MTFPIPQEVLDHHLAILGKTGSGKTSTEKLIVEHVVKQDFRVCILDSIKSDWWGITSSADGKSPGLPFKILGGPKGHIPLHSSAGKAIGALVGSGKLPLSIIDMADFEPGGLQRFFVDFAPALMRSARGVVYLVIEEAHEFAPKERAGFGAENMAIHWAKKLATAGRSKGIRLIVATQRVQSLHNAVLGSCETLIAHRLTTPADQEPVLKWLKANANKGAMDGIKEALSQLRTGTAIVCSGEAQIFQQMAFPKFQTYDNTATPTGDFDLMEVKTAPVNQDELRAIIGDAVKEAEANDPAILKAEIARLRKEGAGAGKVAPQPTKTEIDHAYSDGYRTGHEHGYSRGRGEAVKILGLVQDAVAAIPHTVATGAQAAQPLEVANPPKADGRREEQVPTLAAPPRTVPENPDAYLTSAAQRMLTVIDTDPPVRRSWVQIATLAGLKARGGYFGAAKKSLMDSGLLQIEGGLVRIAKPTGAKAPDHDPAQMVKTWEGILSGAAPKILRHIYAVGGSSTREDIAAALHMQPRGGYWGAAWKELRDNEIVNISGDIVTLSEVFHP